LFVLFICLFYLLFCIIAALPTGKTTLGRS
jgi:hypothetical protein